MSNYSNNNKITNYQKINSKNHKLFKIYLVEVIMSILKGKKDLHSLTLIIYLIPKFNKKFEI